MLRPVVSSAVSQVVELLALSLLVPLLAGGCAKAPTSSEPAPAKPVTAKAATAKAATAKPATAKPATAKPASVEPVPGGSCEEGEGGEHGASCEGASAPVRNPAQVRVTTASGGEALHVGDAFAPAGEVPTVKVSALLAEPDKWVGKRVRIQGDVTAMCHHKRGWFAVAAEDKSGRALRVITTPVFRVPQGSIGRAAVAEGRVDVIQVAARFARHMADEHKLGDPNGMVGPQRQVILRATGAEFQ